MVGLYLFALTELYVEVGVELGAAEHIVQGDQDLLEGQKDVAAEVGVTDGVLQLD